MDSFDSSLIEPIEMRMIRPSPFEVRQNLDKNDPEFKSLTSSIKEHGLLQPILIRPIQHGFELVAGYRRLEACRTLRWRFIQCKISDISDKQAYEIQISENIQRKALNPIEEAEAFKKYVDEFGWGGIAELAQKINKSSEYISHRIQLLRLGAQARQQIIHKSISASHGMELLGFSPQEQPQVLDRMLKEQLTIKQVRKIRSEKKIPLDNKVQPWKLARKSTLVLKIALTKMDSLIYEAKKIQDEKSRNQMVSYLMDARYKIHEMIDSSLRVQKEKMRSSKL